MLVQAHMRVRQFLCKWVGNSFQKCHSVACVHPSQSADVRCMSTHSHLFVKNLFVSNKKKFKRKFLFENFWEKMCKCSCKCGCKNWVRHRLRFCCGWGPKSPHTKGLKKGKKIIEEVFFTWEKPVFFRAKNVSTFYGPLFNPLLAPSVVASLEAIFV